MLHDVSRVFRKRIEQHSDLEVRLSAEQFTLLNAICCMEKEVIQKDLAEHTGKDKSAILRIIDTLEKKELVRRVVSVQDRRKNYLMVTKLGNRILEQHMAIVTELTGELSSGLIQEQIRIFNEVVSHIAESARKLLS